MDRERGKIRSSAPYVPWYVTGTIIYYYIYFYDIYWRIVAPRGVSNVDGEAEANL